MSEWRKERDDFHRHLAVDAGDLAREADLRGGRKGGREGEWMEVEDATEERERDGGREGGRAYLSMGRAQPNERLERTRGDRDGLPLLLAPQGEVEIGDGILGLRGQLGVNAGLRVEDILAQKILGQDVL